MLLANKVRMMAVSFWALVILLSLVISHLYYTKAYTTASNQSNVQFTQQLELTLSGRSGPDFQNSFKQLTHTYLPQGHFKKALLFDRHLQVIASTDSNLNGQLVAQLGLEQMVFSALKSARSQGQSQVVYFDNRSKANLKPSELMTNQSIQQVLKGASEIAVSITPINLAPERLSYLLLVPDYANAKLAAKRVTWRLSLLLFFGALLVLSFWFFAINKNFQKPIALLLNQLNLKDQNHSLFGAISKRVNEYKKQSEQFKQLYEDTEQSYKQRFNALPFAVFQTDSNGFIQAANDSVHIYFGTEDETLLIGTQLHELFLNTDHQKFQQLMNQSNVQSIDASPKKHPSSLFQIQINQIETPDKAFIFTAIDLTNSLQIKRDLESQHEEFRLLFDKSPVGLIKSDWSEVKTLLESQQVNKESDLFSFLAKHASLLAEVIKKVQLVNVNPIALSMFRVELAQQLYSLIFKANKKAVKTVFKEFLLALLRGGQYFESDLSIRFENGERVHFLIRFYQDGHQQDWSKVYAVLIDVTEKQKLEDKLQEQALIFSRWKESNFIGVLHVKESGEVIDANQTALKLFGFNQAELDSGLFNWRQQTPVEHLASSEDAIKQTLENGYWTPFKKEYYNKAGEKIPALVGGMLFKIEPNEYIVFIIDLTEQEKLHSELSVKKQFYAKILNNLAGAVIGIDKTGVIKSFNHHAEAMFGYQLDEALGQNVKILMNDNDAKQHQSYLHNYSQSGKRKISPDGRQLIGKRKNGELFPLLLSIAELSELDTYGVHYIGICHDLSSKVEKEEQLKRAEKMAALGILSSGVSHDFNNILAIISGYCGILQQQLTGDEKKLKYVKQIAQASARGAHLTKKLLDISKQDSVEVSYLFIHEHVRVIESELKEALGNKHKLDLQLSASMLPVKVDVFDFDNAIINLVINAKHAMKDNGVVSIVCREVSLATEQASRLNCEPGRYICLTISDTGAGIEADVQAKIFEPFFSTKGEKGTGLGLTQVYNFIRRSHGAIKVSSAQPKGCCFELYFPALKVVELVDDASKQSTASATEFNENELSKDAHLKDNRATSVIVVDDESEIAAIVEDVLVTEGYQVNTFLKAEHALEYLGEHSVDIVLSDVRMDGMNGYQLCNQIADNHPEIKCLLMSGHNEHTASSQFEERLQQNCLEKPFTREALLNKVSAIA
ncbi:PAS domain S-box protein [Catenovulum sp. SM1970]|uniref:PAS domain S-box protein n=1 Tax=Marinifaba aquimaris TaxID=2741323 RepID=UPI001574CADC|nr:PAS domain S-box protein [Marinifaba aquimaris]NTS76446.1 PAS domain S-box protein [Marinifaba aquimaris]